MSKKTYFLILQHSIKTRHPFMLRCPRPRPRGLAAPRSTTLAPLGLRSSAKLAPPSATKIIQKI